ncbi:rhomboid family protein [Marinigracilibium pacificum]|uniref:Rhomboid family intramembrane serine protease n=1 Tax=Marinigracilibium pacificum TaxID=2729599 RepID=A0A848IYA0_9BACT|nr:rhomboid family intramembrane serine protease [Marinigracilibium pacificum]NMM48148.1 rhomboid family intramembrane serine protease [Marinigracilibium pacificum]
MEPIIYLFIFIIGLTSYKGFTDYSYQQKYVFDIDRILINKEYYRILSSGFLHGDWFHLGFNMIALSSFGSYAIFAFGLSGFLLIYFAGLIGGNLLALFVHRNHGDYKALGASGAIYAVVFSTIVIDPFSEISFIIIPFGFDSWLMGLLFVIFSIWGIKKQKGNIGHEAHLGGAIVGMIIPVLLIPSVFIDNLWVYGLLGIPALGFVLYIIKHPTFLLYESFGIPIRQPSKVAEISNQEQIDFLLDKISDKGYSSLSEKEKERLKELSK